jgi:hypothetical protein
MSCFLAAQPNKSMNAGGKRRLSYQRCLFTPRLRVANLPPALSQPFGSFVKQSEQEINDETNSTHYYFLFTRLWNNERANISRCGNEYGANPLSR